MLKRKKQIFILSLILTANLCLSSCTTTNYDNCPVYPIAGKKVAKELENIPYEGYENTWEWLGRIEKLKQELDLCQKR